MSHVHTEVLELEVAVTPSRVWKAILDLPHLAPTLLPDLFEAFSYIKGSGEVGSLREVRIKNPATGVVVSSQEAIDVVDEANHKFAYHVEGGDLKKIYSNYKLTAVILPGSDTGKSKVQYTIESEPLVELPPSVNEEHKAGFFGLTKAVEAYLLANEAVYA